MNLIDRLKQLFTDDMPADKKPDPASQAKHENQTLVDAVDDIMKSKLPGDSETPSSSKRRLSK